MIFDYYNIICPKCNHRLIYNIRKDEMLSWSRCICAYTLYTHDYNDLLLLFVNKESNPIISYLHSDQNFEIANAIYNCLFIDENNKLISFNNINNSLDELYSSISNMFNLALKVKIKLENNLLFA